jgi:hypothetical protein
MESLSSTGIKSSEPSGKSIEDLLDEYSKNYKMIRRKAAQPCYILVPIDYKFVGGGYKEIVIW